MTQYFGYWVWLSWGLSVTDLIQKETLSWLSNSLCKWITSCKRAGGSEPCELLSAWLGSWLESSTVTRTDGVNIYGWVDVCVSLEVTAQGSVFSSNGLDWCRWQGAIAFLYPRFSVNRPFYCITFSSLWFIAEGDWYCFPLLNHVTVIEWLDSSNEKHTMRCDAGGPQQKMTDVAFCCLVMLWLSHSSSNEKAKHTPSGMLQGEFSHKILEIYGILIS